MDRSGLVWLLIGAGLIWLAYKASVPSPGDPGYGLWYAMQYGELPKS